MPAPQVPCPPCPSPAVAAQLQALDQDVADLQQATGALQQDMANVKAVGDKLSSVFPEVKTAIETVRAEAAAKAAEAMCGYSLLALMATKESVDRAFESPLSEGLLFERRLFHALFSSADQKEGMGAFLEKRAPGFTHR